MSLFLRISNKQDNLAAPFPRFIFLVEMGDGGIFYIEFCLDLGDNLVSR